MSMPTKKLLKIGVFLRPLPAIPTDNIYKFFAILGLWMMLGVAALLGWFIYLDFQLEDQSIASRAYYSSLNSLEDIESRLNSIEQGEFDQNKLDWIPSNWDIEQEKHALTFAQDNHTETISNNKWAIKREVGKELRYLEHPAIISAGVAYIAIAVFLFYFGFKGWKIQVHDLDVEIKQANIQLVKLSNKKLELEIKSLQRGLRHPFLPR